MHSAPPSWKPGRSRNAPQYAAPNRCHHPGRRDVIVQRLRRVSRPRRADMEHALAHGLEHGPAGVQHGYTTTGENRERALLRLLHTAGDGRIEIVEAHLLERRAELARALRL